MIEPGFEIFLGFFMGISSYFALIQDIPKIMGTIVIVSFVIATLVAFSNNDLSAIIANYAYFVIGGH